MFDSRKLSQLKKGFKGFLCTLFLHPRDFFRCSESSYSGPVNLTQSCLLGKVTSPSLPFLLTIAPLADVKECSGNAEYVFSCRCCLPPRFMACFLFAVWWCHLILSSYLFYCFQNPYQISSNSMDAQIISQSLKQTKTIKYRFKNDLGQYSIHKGFSQPNRQSCLLLHLRSVGKALNYLKGNQSCLGTPRNALLMKVGNDPIS